jgi:hypothetical protein
MTYNIVLKRPSQNLYWKRGEMVSMFVENKADATQYKTEAAAKGVLTRMLTSTGGFGTDYDDFCVEAS